MGVFVNFKFGVFFLCGIVIELCGSCYGSVDCILQAIGRGFYIYFLYYVSYYYLIVIVIGRVMFIIEIVGSEIDLLFVDVRFLSFLGWRFFIFFLGYVDQGYLKRMLRLSCKLFVIGSQ